MQESAALLKVKADDCLKQQSNPVEIAEEDANKLSAELQQQRQLAHTQKEEQVILLREDDKKIEAGRAVESGAGQPTRPLGAMGKPE